MTLVLLSAPFWAPLIGLLAALVRLDGGPAFYAQPRVGRFGRVFSCWKLRSMIPGADRQLRDLCLQDPDIAAEWAENQKLARDPRITRVGRFLRASSLDELPQLWNVLRGEMSLVGPRPFMVEQTALYTGAGGYRYFEARPGITGPWQTEGRGRTNFGGRVSYDTAYCEGLSMTRDLHYIWRTLGVILRCKGH